MEDSAKGSAKTVWDSLTKEAHLVIAENIKPCALPTSNIQHPILPHDYPHASSEASRTSRLSQKQTPTAAPQDHTCVPSCRPRAIATQPRNRGCMSGGRRCALDVGCWMLDVWPFSYSHSFSSC